MHVPDGFLDLPTSVATGVASASMVGFALTGARRQLDDRLAPMAGLTATFIFAAQMVNFPVGAGTSGHLLGGALAAALVGPWVGMLCMTVVLMVQALLFADGGITALGTNVLLMGVIGVLVGWGVQRLLLVVLPKRPASVAPAAAIAALVSVPAAALGFVALYSVGGVAPIPMDKLVTAMVGWHVVIGLGEMLITGAVVAAVVRTRPDLVYAARPALARRTADVEIREQVAR